ncbi:GIY-YIG nuclease family protein [Aliivibrio salmonicida]|jgi:putative endonuclease|uniref:GIY-YIG domain-containing protein n=1 Tax=Aliivibrio salmonicida (strain LFI1238) TaxID=316275 RepID=B6ERM7_ALISL|nr:GIY-YIG nuclease family protein [Aliivibrio salmonicida]AZL86721.1 GIY-YIG nuclease family protein [Aliivibrio salmonicida]CAQ81360.1 hypothetical protein VSAL_II0606 [Aliivibrio salmonicida LFI1238]
MKTTDSPWFIYLIRTKLNTLYCGITNNIDRRFLAHQQGKGAKYLKGKGPLQLVWSYEVENKSLALKYEYRIKKLTKTSKEALVSDQRALPSIND